VFWEARVWRPASLTLGNLRRVAAGLRLPIDVVQREIIFYDSLNAIVECAPTKVVLKGGSLISRVYSRIPRFSWDIDLATPAPRRKSFNLETLCSRLRSKKRYSRTRLNGSELILGLYERDKEKDVFVDLYSLRRPMTTYSVGAPLPVFLRSRNLRAPDLDAALLRLRRRLDGLPAVDYVRATVSLGEEMRGGTREMRVPSILSRLLRPVRTVTCEGECEEFCLIDKLARMSQPLTRFNLRDQLCDLYDAGQLLRLKLDAEQLRRRYDTLYRNHAAPPISAMQESVAAKNPILRRVDFSSRREFLMLPGRFNWKNYVDKTMAKASAVLRQI
jgi:hypothetical protein